MKTLRGRQILALLILMPTVVCALAWARTGATSSRARATVLSVDTKHLGHAFAPGAVGLSTETAQLSGGRLDAHHPSLVRLMRLLGPSVLRVGGNSVDRSWWTSSGEPPPPWATTTATPADLTALRGLLVATGWRVLLGVDLGHFEPSRAADEARYARAILGGALVGIEIGNEPNSFGGKAQGLRSSSYEAGEYMGEVEAYRQAIAASAPGTAIYGPALSRTRWLTQIGASANVFTGITQHFYPASECQGGPAAASKPTVGELLSPALRHEEDETLITLSQVEASSGRPTWIGETGTAPCEGKAPASPVLASALWALDWTLRAASSGVTDVSFHGHLGLCGSYNQSPVCAPDSAAASAGDVTPQAEYDGMLAARLLEGGRFLSTHLTGSGAQAGLTTWATLTSSGTIKVAIDDLAISGPSQTVSLSMPGYAATEKTLLARSAYSRSGLKLGGVTVSGTRAWRPKSTRLRSTGGTFRVVIAPASAAIIALRPASPHS
jgi:hypothetical protein